MTLHTYEAVYYNHVTGLEVIKNYTAETLNEAQGFAFMQDAKYRAERGDFKGQLNLVGISQELAW
jgi:hypothetical protein